MLAMSRAQMTRKCQFLYKTHLVVAMMQPSQQIDSVLDTECTVLGSDRDFVYRSLLHLESFVEHLTGNSVDWLAIVDELEHTQVG